MKFDNNYGVSVITGEHACSNTDNPYEVAILLNGTLCYSTHITNDVIGYCNEERVSEIMEQVQKL